MSTARGWAILDSLARQREQIAKRPKKLSSKSFQLQPDVDKFGLWTVTGPTFMTVSITETNARNTNHHVPVKCECGHEQTMRFHDLTRGRTLGCKPCRNNAEVKAQQGADWLARRAGINGERLP